MAQTIYIIGAGAIGKALAVCLRQAGKDAILIRASEEAGTAYTQLVRLLLPDGSELGEEIPVRFLNEFTRLEGMILLTNKAYGNDRLAPKLRPKTGNSPLVLLQNGLTIEQPFLDEGFPAVYRCVLLATSQTLGPGTVRYRPVAASPIGLINGSAGDLDGLVEAMHTAAFPFRAETDIQPVIWEKAILNCVFNAVCPLLNVDNGIFHREPSAFEVAQSIIQEGISLAAELGVQLNRQDVETRLMQISRGADGQLISTLVDINHGRETELDRLHLAMVRLAEPLRKTHLIPQIKLLGELTKLKSDLSRSTPATPFVP